MAHKGITGSTACSVESGCDGLCYNSYTRRGISKQLGCITVPSIGDFRRPSALAYPVFDSFEDDRFTGVLATDIYWKLFCEYSSSFHLLGNYLYSGELV
jgi:hypothetical protein